MFGTRMLPSVYCAGALDDRPEEPVSPPTPVGYRGSAFENYQQAPTMMKQGYQVC